jgi:hypothetical protein
MQQTDGQSNSRLYMTNEMFEAAMKQMQQQMQ